MTVAVRAENLAKRYRIGRNRGRAGYRTLREALVESVSRPLQRILHPSTNRRTEDFWALKDASFEIATGEAVGIIGRNGSGKSTLLKILTRITEPTRGQADLYGRVGSLLEVGTGFHPELTGRENVFLNGSILGLTRAEIRRSFETIVDFSGVEQFIDTPVKRYSSGMKVRLAFSIAAHLQPEILLIDEVLAVGDLSFQRKCLGRMGEIASTGRTVLFVSHDMLAVRRLCSRAILLEAGDIVAQGDVQPIVDQYLDRQQLQAGSGEVVLKNWSGERTGPQRGKIAAVRMLDERNNVCSVSRIGDTCTFEVDLKSVAAGYTISLAIFDRNGVCIYHLRSQDAEKAPVPSALARVRVVVPKLQIREGEYSLNVWLGDTFNRLEECVHRVLSFSVRNPGTTVNTVQSIIVEPGEWQFFDETAGSGDRANCA